MSDKDINGDRLSELTSEVARLRGMLQRAHRHLATAAWAHDSCDEWDDAAKARDLAREIEDLLGQ